MPRFPKPRNCPIIAHTSIHILNCFRSHFHFNWTYFNLVMSERLAFLKNTEPFSLLPQTELETVANELSEIHYYSRELLYQQNKTSVEGLDIIVKGSYDAFILTSENQKKSKQNVSGPFGRP